MGARGQECGASRHLQIPEARNPIPQNMLIPRLPLGTGRGRVQASVPHKYASNWPHSQWLLNLQKTSQLQLSPLSSSPSSKLRAPTRSPARDKVSRSTPLPSCSFDERNLEQSNSDLPVGTTLISLRAPFWLALRSIVRLSILLTLNHQCRGSFPSVSHLDHRHQSIFKRLVAFLLLEQHRPPPALPHPM